MEKKTTQLYFFTSADSFEVLVSGLTINEFSENFLCVGREVNILLLGPQGRLASHMYLCMC